MKIRGIAQYLTTYSSEGTSTWSILLRVSAVLMLVTTYTKILMEEAIKGSIAIISIEHFRIVENLIYGVIVYSMIYHIIYGWRAIILKDLNPKKKLIEMSAIGYLVLALIVLYIYLTK